MELKKIEDLFALRRDLVTKRNLFDLIQFSKVENSPYWAGPDAIIGNTPQQGINWLGQPPNVRAVIVKTRPGSYEDDGWADDGGSFRYSFKAINGSISYTDTANRVLIEQPQERYPIFLLTEDHANWRFEGLFDVSDVADRFVVLRADQTELFDQSAPNAGFKEGEKRYVTHLVIERSRSAVKAAKSSRSWICDICRKDFRVAYGVRYIEAHHKVPISGTCSSYIVNASDFALLCPNCHKAVHIYMRQSALSYDEIKKRLSRSFPLASDR